MKNPDTKKITESMNESAVQQCIPENDATLSGEELEDVSGGRGLASAALASVMMVSSVASAAAMVNNVQESPSYSVNEVSQTMWEDDENELPPFNVNSNPPAKQT